MRAAWRRSGAADDTPEGQRIADDVTQVLEARLSRIEIAIGVIVACAALLALAFGLLPMPGTP